jgi:hypothetical protein
MLIIKPSNNIKCKTPLLIHKNSLSNLRGKVQNSVLIHFKTSPHNGILTPKDSSFKTDRKKQNANLLLKVVSIFLTKYFLLPLRMKSHW